MDDFAFQALQLLSQRRRLADASDAHETVGSPVQAQRWNLAQTVGQHLWERLEQAVRTGARHPDKPIELSFEDSCLLNFGTMPDLLKGDMLETQAERAGVGAVATAELPQDLQPGYRRLLGFLEMHYAELHASSGVYNLEPWLQEMYRDCLDIDYRQTLREQAQILQEEIRAVPDRLISMGVPDALVSEIMVALRSYQHVQDEAHAREKTKTSVLRARTHAAATQQMQSVLKRAERHVRIGDAREGQSPLEDLFSCWKEARFELADLGKQLEEYSGTGLQERVEELVDLFSGVRKTLTRCAEEMGTPQYSLLHAAEAGRICPRQVVEEELEALLTHDIVGHIDLASERMETRKFGPLCGLIMPGRGTCCYSLELREAQAKRLDQSKRGRRDYDLDRRATYPLNYIVVPSLIPPEKMLESMANAFLEYKAVACRAAYRNTMNEARQLFPEIFEHHANEVEGTKNVNRRKFARYLTAFVRWAKYGRRFEELPCLEEFIAWARRRLKRPEFLIPPRYRCVLEDFAEASPERRETLFRRHMRDRHTVDRMSIVLATLLGDVKAAIGHADFLSAETRTSPYFQKALEPAEDGGPWGRQNADRLFQRFIFAEAELKRLYLSMEMRFHAELDAVRKRALETFGKEISEAEASAAIARRHMQMLEARRRQADGRMDRDLVGLLYCVEQNYRAAKTELSAYLRCLERQRQERVSNPQRFDGSSLERSMGHRGQRLAQNPERQRASSTRVAGGEEHAIIFEDDFVYYNLGSICVKTGDLREASDYFSRFCLWAAQEHWFLFGEFAREINEELEIKIREANSGT